MNNKEECVEDLYEIHRVSSTREIHLDTTGNSINKYTLFGGIRYNYNKFDNTVNEILGKLYNKKIVYVNLPFLHDSEVEVNLIGELLQEEGKIVNKYIGDEGSKKSFLQQSGSTSDCFHISTHGYYTNIQVKNYHFFNDGLKNLFDPMLCSGIFLSGDTFKSSVSRCGFVSSKEISMMNFSNVELVVLATCNSGREIEYYNEMYGLYRAFIKAGAKTIIMSLDEVRDDDSKIFFVEFYRNLMKGMSKFDAFSLAKKKFRDTHDRYLPYVMLN